MITCCVVFVIVIPSLTFWGLGLVIGGLSGLCTSTGDVWAMALYMFVNMIYIVNIVASLTMVEDEIPIFGGSWIPSLWGKYRWLGATFWLFDLWCLGYFLWTHHLFGFSSSTICLSGQGHMGFISIVGMVAIGLSHILTVILWKMCRSRQTPLPSSSPLISKETLLQNVVVRPY